MKSFNILLFAALLILVCKAAVFSQTSTVLTNSDLSVKQNSTQSEDARIKRLSDLGKVFFESEEEVSKRNLRRFPAVDLQFAPKLDGRIETDPATGVLRGDICLSKLPQQKSYSFLLNRGLNIREIRDADSGKPLEYDGFYNATNIGDATRYEVKNGIGAGGFCVNYVGAYPVYRVDAGERSELDWKGQIAFDGRTVRAAEQTRFYPVVTARTARRSTPFHTNST